MAQSLTTSRLTLEPCTQAHLQGYHKIWSNPETTFWRCVTTHSTPAKCKIANNILFSSRGGSDSLETSAKWLENVRGDTGKPNLFSWAVFRSESREDMIGIIVLSRSPPSIEIFGTECLLVGYFFHPSCWANGYATEALNAGIESVKDRTRGCRLVGWISPGNTASERVAKKCGFSFDRYYKRDDSKIFVGGEWRENGYNLFVKDI